MSGAKAVSLDLFVTTFLFALFATTVLYTVANSLAVLAALRVFAKLANLVRCTASV